jgi:hypothetical protein
MDVIICCYTVAKKIIVGHSHVTDQVELDANLTCPEYELSNTGKNS